MRKLAETLTCFSHNLKASGDWKNTLVLTYSEFGRRLQENANAGTDHGTTAPHLVMGGLVKGGVYGKYPALDNLDSRGDLIYNSDFRDAYNSIAKNWWNLKSSTLAKANTLNFL